MSRPLFDPFLVFLSLSLPVQATVSSRIRKGERQGLVDRGTDADYPRDTLTSLQLVWHSTPARRLLRNYSSEQRRRWNMMINEKCKSHSPTFSTHKALWNIFELIDYTGGRNGFDLFRYCPLSPLSLSVSLSPYLTPLANLHLSKYRDEK